MFSTVTFNSPDQEEKDKNSKIEGKYLIIFEKLLVQ
jgi:hypothetical protein